MKRSFPLACVVLSLVAAFCPGAFAQAEPASLAGLSVPAPATEAASESHADDIPDLPEGFRELIGRAQKCFDDGSELLKAGESAKARARFNDAVQTLLESGLDLNSTPILHRFFQDLIQQIHQDESRYLQPQEVVEEKQEGAVVDELEKLDLIPISVDPALQDVVEADIADSKYDIPVVLNEAVLKALNYWLAKGRKYFSDGLKRSGRYRQIIEGAFRSESIPLDLMYLAQVESLFKTNAISRARARGIWQFGRGTAIRYGLKVNRYIDERSDPEKSTMAAARYLNELYAIFKDWNLALAAYNWGEGKVQRLVERTGRSDFWNLLELKRNFPRETRNHVPLIIASIILARNPEKYGLPLELDPPVSYERVPVSKPIDLRRAAKLLGISLEHLKELNPALRGLSTPPGYPDFELKVPLGTHPDMFGQLAALPEVKARPQPEYGDRYRVRPGDTLGAIANRLGVSVSALQDANDIRSPKSLREGTWLSVPGGRIRSSPSKLNVSVKKAQVSPPRSNSPAKAGSASKTQVPKTGAKQPLPGPGGRQAAKDSPDRMASR